MSIMSYENIAYLHTKRYYNLYAGLDILKSRVSKRTNVFIKHDTMENNDTWVF